MKVYHGTMKKIKGNYLIPHRAFELPEYGRWVHFATSYEIALLYSSNPIRAFFKESSAIKIPAFSQHLCLDRDIPKIYELYIGMFENLYHIPVYVYECEVDDKELIDPFSPNNYEKVTTKKVRYSKVYEIPDLLEKLKNCEKEKRIELVNYENVLKIHDFYYDHLDYKVSQARTQWEADFYYKNFPDVWEIIESIPEKFKHKNN